MKERVYTDFHFFCGIGGTRVGTRRSRAAIAGETAMFETLGGVDFDAAACRDFTRLTGAAALCADVTKLEPAELVRFAGARRPDAVFSSPPCKGYSRLLSNKRAQEPKYQAMNQLLLRALFLCCSSWDEPPPLMFFENVPGIMTRGRDVVDQAIKMLHAHGYAVDVGNHDCGEIGNLAQRRPRWFMVARHRTRLPHVVYEPAKRGVRACGEVIGPMPMPGDVDRGGPMHSVPKLSWNNWKRLAAIPAGGDWRDLAGTVPAGKKRREVHRRHAVLAYEEPSPAVTGPGGHAADNLADPRPANWFHGAYGVTAFDEATGTVTSGTSPSAGAPVVADPRPCFANRMPVAGWEAPAPTVIGAPRPGSGALSVADPRPFSNIMVVGKFDEPARTVVGASRVGSGALSVADPRVRFSNALQVVDFDEATPTIIGQTDIQTGALSVADPRFKSSLGVIGFDQVAATVTGEAYPSNGRFSVADPRFGHVERVTDWDKPTGVVTHAPAPSSGAPAVADPRWGGGRRRVDGFHVPVPCVTGNSRADGAGAANVADPRASATWQRVAGVTAWDQHAPTVTSQAKIHTGAFQVADPRPFTKSPRNGQYKVLRWDAAAGTVTGYLDVTSGPAVVADPRVGGATGDPVLVAGMAEDIAAAELRPDRPPTFIPVIIAADGTWHRPLTTYELLALQSLPLFDNDGRPMVLDGTSHTRWRMAIGNAVPPDSAERVGEQFLAALIRSELGLFTLSAAPVWVAPARDDRAEVLPT